LDLPPQQRWLEAGTAYADQKELLIAYFESMVSPTVLSILVEIGKLVVNYKGFGDFGDEMKGYAKGLGIDVGYVVAANLIYQIESIGVNCSNWNNTGPTGACKKKHDSAVLKLHSRHFMQTLSDTVQTGLCTSVVANTATNQGVLHGRNLDWNLEDKLLDWVIDVDFHRSGTHAFTGTTLVSFVGILNGMVPGGSGFTYSLDARCQGGKLLINFLEALALGAMTPSQHARIVLETATDFNDAVTKFQSGDLVDDVYYIVAGAQSGEGVVVTRDRNKVKDTWMIGTAEEGGADWYVLETNYDHWEKVPTADDRRTPGNSHMVSIGQRNMVAERLFDNVMSQWPTYNPHTDITCIMSAHLALYNCSVWRI